MGVKSFSRPDTRYDSMAAPKKRSFVRRWTGRLARLLLALTVLAAVAPFAFTTALTRYALTHSPYAAFSPTIESAKLGIFGGLSLRGVALREAGPRSDAPLLEAREVTIDFSWTGLLGRRLNQINAAGVTVHVRPGTTHACTLQTLAWPPTMDGIPAALVSGPASAADPLWIERIHIEGALRVASFELQSSPAAAPPAVGVPAAEAGTTRRRGSAGTASLAVEELPFVLEVAMTGVRHTPEIHLDAKVGGAALPSVKLGAEAEANPYPVFPGFTRPVINAVPSVAARVRFVPTPAGGRQTVLESFEAHNLSLLWNTGEAAREWAAVLPARALPPLASDEILVELAALSAQGTSGAGGEFAGSLDVRGLAAAQWPAPMNAAVSAGTLIRDLTARVQWPPQGSASGTQPGRTAAVTMDVHWADLRWPPSAAGSAATDRPAWAQVAPLDIGSGSCQATFSGAGACRGTLNAGAVTVGPWHATELAAQVETTPAQWSGTVKLHALGGTLSGAATLARTGTGTLATSLTIEEIEPRQALLAAGFGALASDATSLTGKLSATAHVTRAADGAVYTQLDVAQGALAVAPQLARALVPALPADGTGPLAVGWSALGMDWSMTPGQTPAYAATMNLQGLTCRTATGATSPLLLDAVALDLAATYVAPAQGRASDTDLTGLSISRSKVSWAAVEMGKLRVTDLTADLATQHQASGDVLQATNLGFGAFGGTFAGEARANLANIRDMAGRLTIKTMDQHQLLAVFAPDKVDAQGTVSGTARVAMASEEGMPILLPRRQVSAATGPAATVSSPPGVTGSTNLLVTVDLTSDGPGRLFIKDETVARQLAAGVPAGVAGDLLPDSFSDIVVGQLKNYPYLQGAVGISTRGGHPVLTLNYRRAPLTPGEPGYGVSKKIQGVDTRVSYPIHLAGDTITIGNMTLIELLGMATGLHRALAPGSPTPSPR
jgi:hypothetical protein